MKNLLLDNGGVPEECHDFLRAFQEVLQCVHMVKVSVCSARHCNSGALLYPHRYCNEGIGVRSLAYSVHIGGISGVGLTTKPGQVDLVVTWEMKFTLCVSGWGRGT